MLKIRVFDSKWVSVRKYRILRRADVIFFLFLMTYKDLYQLPTHTKQKGRKPFWVYGLSIWIVVITTVSYYSAGT